MGGREPLRPDEFETVVDGKGVGPAVSATLAADLSELGE